MWALYAEVLLAVYSSIKSRTNQSFVLSSGGEMSFIIANE
jgi:hypothetical protein